MGIKRYFADADNTITNAFEEDLSTRGTGSNMGASDILETFSIYGQSSSSVGLSPELSRILIKFPTSGITSDRSAGSIPASGSVNFYLKMYNVKHARTLPKNYTLQVASVSRNWEEGTGLDMEFYSDLTNNNSGSNWMSASVDSAWTSFGGDYHSDVSSSFTQTFDLGTEELEIDITTLVEQWLNSSGNVLGSKNNYGVGIRFSDSYEAYYSSSAGADVSAGGIIHNVNGATKSYYTKRFYGRGTEFHFKKPVIEARWDSTTRDDRGAFYFSSSLAPASDNLNTIYLYNYVRGRLVNIPSIGTKTLRVSVFSGSSANNAPFGGALTLSADGKNVIGGRELAVTGGYVSTGIYSASFAFTGSSSLTKVFDVWFSGSNSINNADASSMQFYTGSIDTKSLYGYGYSNINSYVLSMPKLQKEYYKDQTARLGLFVREKNWNPSIYSKATSTIYSTIIPSASYRVFRVVDDWTVVSYGTGSQNYSGLSYDVSGSYFDLNMSMFEPGYQYGLKFSFKDTNTGTYHEQPYVFKFRVIE